MIRALDLKNARADWYLVSYADFVIVSILHWMKRLDERFYERAVGIEPALKHVYEASKQWLERDDH